MGQVTSDLIVVGGQVGAVPAVPPRDAAPRLVNGTAGLRGRVIDAQTGTPIRQAQVAASSSTGIARRTTTTDADGRWELVQLPAGQYIVQITKPPYLPRQYGQRRPLTLGTPVSVRDGETVGSLDVALSRGGVISGRITDQFGDPVASVQVQAQRLVYDVEGNPRPTFAGSSATTDDMGRYRLFGLDDGEYIVTASGNVFPTIAPFNMADPRDVREALAPTHYPGVIDPLVAQLMSIRAGEEVTADFSMQTTRLAMVLGTVVNSQGRPGAGLQIMLTTPQTGGITRGVGIAAADGSFVLQNIVPGEYSLVARPGGMPGQTPPEFGSTRLVVNGEPVTGVEIVTSTGATIRGQVRFNGTTPPPTTARVVVSGREGPGFRPDGDDGLVDAEGRFTVRNVNGRVLFQIAAPGWMTQSVMFEARDVTEVPLDLAGRSAVDDLTIVVTDRMTEVRGQVTNSRGEAEKDYVVVLQRLDLPAESSAAFKVRTVRPGPDGRFQGRGLRPGRYVATAVDPFTPSREYDPAFQQELRPRGTAFTLREGESITLDLKLVPGL